MRPSPKYLQAHKTEQNYKRGLKKSGKDAYLLFLLPDLNTLNISSSATGLT